MLSKIVQIKLKLLAKLILLKYKPFVVGITGSVGKTSTKEAVFSVVSAKYNARSSEKNYNNEFGLARSRRAEAYLAGVLLCSKHWGW